MPKQGKLEYELFVMLITIVATSAVIFTLVRADIIQIKPSSQEVNLLNVDFLPYPKEGTLLVKDFQFCEDVDERFECVEPKEQFKRGEEVHFRFVVETGSINRRVQLLQNYRIKGPDGTVLLEIDDNRNLLYDQETAKETEKIYFKDSFITENSDPLGTYTVEIVIYNSLFDKRVTLKKEVVIDE